MSGTEAPLYPDFLNTLPAEWKVLPVCEACTFTTKPRALDLREYSELAFVPMELIPTGQLKFSNFILKRSAEVSSGTYFEEGDLLVSKITPCFENGKQGIAQAILNGFGIATTEVIPLKPRDGLTHLPFVAYYLLHEDVRSQLAAAMEGATGRQRLPKDLLAQWPVPIPPLDEQRAIAHLLETIQRVAQVEGAMADNFAALKSATMAKLFREGLRGEPLKQTEIGEIPESWNVLVCEDLCDSITVGIVVTPAKYYVPAGVPCFRSFNIRPNRLWDKNLVFISPESNELHSKSKLRTGDVLIVRTGYPGTACVVPPSYDGANCIDLLIARPKATLIDGRYLAAYLNSPEAKTQVTRQQGGLAQQHYNVGALRRLKVPLPDPQEQIAIAEVAETIERRLIVSEQKTNVLKALFCCLLHQLMTGAIRVKDFDLAEVSHA